MLGFTYDLSLVGIMAIAYYDNKRVSLIFKSNWLTQNYHNVYKLAGYLNF